MPNKKKPTVVFTPGFLRDLKRTFGWRGKFSNLKWRIKASFQRMFRGFDDSAYWNLNNYISDVALKSIKWMEKNAFGHPTKLKNMKEWRDVLKKIRKGFEAYEKTHYDYIKNKKLREKYEKEYKEGMKLFAEFFPNLWD